jgi:hypothetical protein
VQRRARADFELLKENPRHPSLHLKKVGDFWSVRIGASYRALALEEAGNLVWFWIGHHDGYYRVIGER